MGLSDVPSHDWRLFLALHPTIFSLLSSQASFILSCKKYPTTSYYSETTFLAFFSFYSVEFEKFVLHEILDYKNWTMNAK